MRRRRSLLTHYLLVESSLGAKVVAEFSSLVNDDKLITLFWPALCEDHNILCKQRHQLALPLYGRGKATYPGDGGYKPPFPRR